MNIFVSSLSYNVTDTDLKSLFEEYGVVTSAKIIMDRATSRSRGFGFVEMENNAEALKAILELDQAEYNGRTISVSEAKPREENNNRSNNRSNGGYNRNRY